MRILFAGTPKFAVTPLTALLEQQFDIVAVFTQPDRRAGRGKKLTPPPVKTVAEQHSIPVFQPDSLKDQIDTIKQLNIDVMVVVAYGMLLPQSILDIPPLGCINIHASILPRWRGAAPIQRAIEADDKQTGVSIMKMELGLDTGPVYQTLATDIAADDTSASLHDKLAQLGALGICQTLELFAKLQPPIAVEQDDSQANYAKKISKQEAIIDWQQSASQIEQKIRAFNPWPICQCQHQDTRIRIWQASVVETSSTNQNCGQITNINEQGITVACQTGHLRLETLQRDGSKPLNSNQFINGYTLTVNDYLS